MSFYSFPVITENISYLNQWPGVVGRNTYVHLAKYACLLSKFGTSLRGEQMPSLPPPLNEIPIMLIRLEALHDPHGETLDSLT